MKLLTVPFEQEASATSGSATANLPSTDEFLAAAKGEPSMDLAARPPTSPAVRKAADAIQEVGGRRLNDEQRWAVASFLKGGGRSAPFALFGPPGTGKTVTLVECALQVSAVFWG